MEQPKINQRKQYKAFTFSRHDTCGYFQATILDWLEATGNKLDGDIVTGFNGDDFVQDKITCMVPFIESFLETGMHIDANGDLHYQLTQVLHA